MITQEAIQQACEKLVVEFGIQDERLLQSQIADALRQAIAAGDFERHVYHQGSQSDVIYVPFSGVDRLRSENRKLKERILELENEKVRLESEALERSTW